MKVETKFAPGDSIWFMHSNKITNLSLHSVNIFVSSTNEKFITYEFSGMSGSRKEEELFATKEELIKSL